MDGRRYLSWYVIGDADKVIPPDIQLKFAIRAKSKVYHVPGGDHPSMIAHLEVAADAIRDAANAVSALAGNHRAPTFWETRRSHDGRLNL